MSDVQLIKQLREKTGAGMADCQKALAEAGDDLNKAIEVLRKKGLEKAVKKAERSTAEGLIAMALADNKLAVVGLACETDFVALNKDFIKAVDQMAQQLLITDLEPFKTWADEKIKNELIIKIGENMRLGSCGVHSGDLIGSYLHSNKKVAAVVIMKKGNQELANDLAMQVAAMSPKYLAPADVASEELEKEKEIYREQLKNEGKPAAIWDKIIAGKLDKYYSEVCLLKQVFIKDDKMTIEALLKANGDAEIESFSRYQI
ncbi:MAG: translation elongation factor Ts [Patescibacteria group bacterium]